MWPPPAPPPTSSPLHLAPPPLGSPEGTSHTTDAAGNLQRQSSVASEGTQGSVKRSETGETSGDGRGFHRQGTIVIS